MDSRRAAVRLHQECRKKLSLIDRNVPARVFRAHVFRSRPDQPIVVELFDYMGGPSADSRDGKYWSEQINIDSQRVIRGSRIEINIGIQLFVGLHKLFDLAGRCRTTCLARSSSPDRAT